MGCDIHTHVEVRRDGKWQFVRPEIFPLDDWDREYRKKEFGSKPFDWRSYGMFGFLAGVRNYSAVTPLAEPRGIPEDASPEVQQHYEDWSADAHSLSWLSLADLLSVDYDEPIEDRRYTKQTGPNSYDGGAMAEAGKGEMTTRRDFLGTLFMRHLDALKTLGAPEDVRVVFWFDN